MHGARQSIALDRVRAACRARPDPVADTEPLCDFAHAEARTLISPALASRSRGLGEA